MTAERTSIRGVLETVFHSGPTFSAGRLRAPDGAIVKFAGKVFFRENGAVRLEGHWTHHPKYGRQFEAEFMGHDLEMDPDGLADFLANHPDVKGIGPAKARLIADAFGSGFDSVIRSRPEDLAAAAGFRSSPFSGLSRCGSRPARLCDPRPVRPHARTPTAVPVTF